MVHAPRFVLLVVVVVLFLGSLVLGFLGLGPGPRASAWVHRPSAAFAVLLTRPNPFCARHVRITPLQTDVRED